MALTQIVNDGLGASLTATSDGGAVTTSVQQGLAKAWCHFDGTDGTVSIYDGLNHASISDLGSGRYSVTFTNSFSNNYYSSNVTGSTTRSGSNDTGSHATGGITYEFFTDTGSFADPKIGQSSLHGDLA